MTGQNNTPIAVNELLYIRSFRMVEICTLHKHAHQCKNNNCKTLNMHSPAKIAIYAALSLRPHRWILGLNQLPVISIQKKWVFTKPQLCKMETYTYYIHINKTPNTGGTLTVYWTLDPSKCWSSDRTCMYWWTRRYSNARRTYTLVSLIIWTFLIF